jgi:hypothetical protein
MLCTKAFDGFGGEISLTGGGSVQTIGAKAFQRCNPKSSIIFPDCDELRAIGDMAFDSCGGLIILHGSVAKLQSIGNSAFAMVGLLNHCNCVFFWGGLFGFYEWPK